MFVSPLILIILLDIINCNNRVEVKVVESHSKVNIGKCNNEIYNNLFQLFYKDPKDPIIAGNFDDFNTVC